MKIRSLALFLTAAVLLCCFCGSGIVSSADDLAPVLSGKAYYINGVYVHVDDFPSSPDECWVYANKLYQKIWGVKFGNSFYEKTNYLRELSREDLILNPEHLRAYVTGAALGSVIRVCNDQYLYGGDGWGHSQIIVYKDRNGFTVLEGGLHTYPYEKETYYTWESYCATGWLGGTYKYIKYIKWPGGTEPYSGTGLFRDVKYDAWYNNAVEYVYSKGLMSGTSEFEFSPSMGTTRGMIVTILYSLADKPEMFDSNVYFDDVTEDQYYYNAVSWAAGNGIVTGYGEGIFGPDDILTREQMAVILNRYALYCGLSTAGSRDLEWCSDYDQIDSWALQAMSWAYFEELMSGTSETTMDPLGQMTRAQAAVIISNFSNNFAGF